ncbi:hypothetical protein OG562_22730 [Streptomyces sp. NBC_01275]|uniref:hypothetical protein n=1 Tax=Streptomyces sp. NBC_01275 TaxID=2903807 RepID=UPI002259822A|nr:hypothetical protein [Streptomyces sp. NBC_01275]MCX4763727.1 hypothetical protein [Streptomyces sp. NBC_01275]
MTSLRARSVLIAAAAVAGTLLMTACQNDDTAQGTATDSAATAQAAAGKSGVSGTFTDGTVAFLAPGKYTVTTGGKAQQFWVAEDTKISGAGGICGDADGQAAEECTEAQLEKATKSGAVPADVVLKDGIAVTVTERPADASGTGSSSTTGGSSTGSSSTGGSSSSSGDSTPSTNGGSSSGGSGSSSGVNGTWLGTVSYLAPGKYTVSDTKDTQQQFWLAEDTKIWGVGGMCGDADGQAAEECTEAQLEKAAKAGTLSATVKVTDGIATSITEEP